MMAKAKRTLMLVVVVILLLFRGTQSISSHEKALYK